MREVIEASFFRLALSASLGAFVVGDANEVLGVRIDVS